MRSVEAVLREAEASLTEIFAGIDRTEQACFARVLTAFKTERVGAQHFAQTTGYGYGDVGRDTLERVYARVLGTESALVRPQIVSGTHALAIALFGMLRPGDRLLAAAGRPYDTLEPVIGLDGADGSLKSFGIGYDEAALLPDGTVDFAAVEAGITERTRVVLVQRSRGYAWRPSLSLETMKRLCALAHAKNPDAVVLVDNCYGEFTGLQEPSAVGADVLAGSLIKNPGGGLAPTGGYLAGRADLVERMATRLTSPGIGAEVGSYAGGYQPFYQGLFMGPHTVAQALKGAALLSFVFADAGFAVQPAYDAERHDIIQAVRLNTPERLVAFCQAVQKASPVDSFALPEPWDMPGYGHQVIMAAGTFVSGASIELSADAPMREPYIAYWQGGLSYAHCRFAVGEALKAVGETAPPTEDQCPSE